jgi:hypothetical protein
MLAAAAPSRRQHIYNIDIKILRRIWREPLAHFCAPAQWLRTNASLQKWSLINQDRDRDFSFCQDVLFQSVMTFLTVKVSSFKVSRSRISIETKIKVKTLLHSLRRDLSRCHFSNCREFLDSHVVLIQSVEKVSTVKTYFLQVSRLRLSFET